MKIGVLFGGRSYEHDISVITAAQVAAALDGRAEVYPIYATEGCFYLLKGGIDINDFASGRVKKRRAHFDKRKGKGVLAVWGRKIVLDCVVLCCHGGEGEDGRFSALLDVYDIPYTASSHLASAVTMDKRYTKTMCLNHLIPTAEGVVGKRGEDVIERAKSLNYPLIVKPARLGSSIGISVAHDESELIGAVALAFAFDKDVVVEEMIPNAMELNCAAFREEDDVVVGGVENPVSWHEFLTFGEKYEGGKYKSGSKSIVRGELAERVRSLTKRVYNDFELDGVVRVDYLYCEGNDTIYLNEINSQPGSFAYYLFEEVGIGFPELLMRVIAQSIHNAEGKDIISFNSRVLENLSVSCQKASRNCCK